ncbi:hypothetical protein [Pelagibacterium sediminicola]|uniref:hypothetical protein n=1 Tax=Pelagibacterium sediminicola TaxID=2248761 RepID=UPI000E31B985|nr:hypothetical protein [Pelagibacterium sediminicola]
MFRNFKSAVVATGLVLATVNAAMAADEYHLMCEEPGKNGWGRMGASASPNAYDTMSYSACGYQMYLDPIVYERAQQCVYEFGINVRVYYHNDYDNRLCTLTP